MKAVIPNAAQSGSPDPGINSWRTAIKPQKATYFSAEMLHRTRGRLDEGYLNGAVDYFALQRMARDLRRDNIARVIYAAQLRIGDAAAWLAAWVGSRLPALGARIARRLDRAIDGLDARAARWQSERREAFLAGSIDLYDLERRMRELEHWSQRPL